MRIILILALFVLAGLFGCDQNEDKSFGTEMIDIPIDENSNVDDSKVPVISFQEKKLEVGKITQGEIVSHTFQFTNTGKSPLLISSVDGSCGCTVPRSYPTGKVMPGEGGEIEVEFDSDGKSGMQTVSIIVSANTIPAATQLLIKTEVVVPDNMN